MRGLILAVLLIIGQQTNALPIHTAKPGGIAVISIGTDEAAPGVVFGQKKVLVIRNEGTWYAVVGIPLSQAVGPATIKVTAAGKADKDIEFEVIEHAYNEQHLKVERSYVDLDQKQLDRVLGERKIIDAALGRWRDVELDSVEMSAPVAGNRSSSFGSRRFFNGQPRSPHSGRPR